tara:strand:- start:2601 stop:2858 length:258 start_codon:yes stop_codon:yes gene_type:complete
MEERKVETRKVVCKTCQKPQEWSLEGKFPNGIKKWRDGEGLICNGKICGSCNRVRVKATMRKGRAFKKDSVVGECHEDSVGEGIS